MLFVYMIVIVLMVFVGVVFVTLFERKILGLVQIRLGPNKIFFKGILQSLGDALKLMEKSNFMYFFFSLIEYNFLSLGMLFLMMSLWLAFPNDLYDYSGSLLLMLCILSVGVYPIMYGSWFSGSLYSMLGSIRSIAQMISYEVSMIIIIISLVFFSKTFNLYMYLGEGLMGLFMLFVFLLFMLFSSFLVELGRTPADLLEGESELVSGFNTEYFGLKFALIFLAEYGMMLFMGGFMGSLMMNMCVFSLGWGLCSLLFVSMIIWIRGIMPRIRYDKLMLLCWIGLLNLSLGILIINIGFIVIN